MSTSKAGGSLLRTPHPVLIKISKITTTNWDIISAKLLKNPKIPIPAPLYENRNNCIVSITICENYSTIAKLRERDVYSMSSLRFISAWNFERFLYNTTEKTTIRHG